MSTAEHASLPPSSAHIWRFCLGWRALMARVDPLPEDRESAEEGNAAHWVNVREFNNLPTALGAQAPNGVHVSEEMADGAELWVDTIRARGEMSEHHVEERIRCGNIHPDNWGTPDHWALDRGRGLLYVDDYKFGFDIVEAFENWQTIDYAGGILERLGIQTVAAAEAITVIFTIVQPRAPHRDGPVRSWVVPAKDLAPYLHALHTAAHASDDPAARCTTGTYCRHCPARHRCEANLREAFAAMGSTGATLPLNMSPDALGREYALIEAHLVALKSRASGISAHIAELLRRGERVAGYHLEQGYGRKTWARDLSEVVALGAMMGVKLDKPAAITPTQAVKAGMPEALVEAYSHTPPGEIKLVRDDLRLPAIFRNT